jgi:hypothetical protein
MAVLMMSLALQFPIVAGWPDVMDLASQRRPHPDHLMLLASGGEPANDTAPDDAIDLLPRPREQRR